MDKMTQRRKERDEFKHIIYIPHRYVETYVLMVIWKSLYHQRLHVDPLDVYKWPQYLQ